MVKILENKNIYELTAKGVEISEIKIIDIKEDSFDIYISGYYDGNWMSNILTLFVDKTIDVALRYITNTGLSNTGAILMAKQIAQATNKIVNLTFAGEIVHSIEP